MSYLKEICAIEYGKALPERVRIPGTAKVFGSAGEVGTHTESLYCDDLIVVGRKGNITDVHRVTGPSWVIDTAYAIRPRDGLSIEYLFYFLKFRSSNFASDDQSTAVPSLSRDVLYNLDLPIVDLKTQKKIVEKIDYLFTEIDAGLEDLKRAKEQLELYKQSVLNAAIRGKLVPQDPNDEPASELLKRIRAEKEKLIREGKLKKQKPLPPIDPREIPFELPQEWEWVRLGELLNDLTDYHANGSYEYLKKNVTIKEHPDYAIMVRTTNFSIRGKEQFIYVDEHAYKTLDKSRLEPGDLIMNKIADPGRVFIVPDFKKPMTLAMNLFQLKTNKDAINNTYLYSCLSVNESYVKSFTTGATTKTITKDAVRQLLIPLPPLDQQTKLSQFFLKSQKTITDVNSVFDYQLNQAIILKQSILKSAFEGNIL